MTQSPSSNIIELRETVQTIPLHGYYPIPSDEYVDLGDYINGLHVILGSEAENLHTTYTGMIVAAAHGGDIFSKTTGLTVWFPYPEDYYNVFKRFSDSYAGLDWTQSRWPEFLNWFYGMDDVRPRPVTLSAGAVGDNNDVRLFWHEAYDLAPVTYDVVEARDTSIVFQDACEDTTQWLLNGFTLSALNFHTGSYSFFSGNASNLSTSMEMQEPLVLEDGGLASIYLYYSTQDPDDSLIIDYGSFRDIHYGLSNGWQERRLFLPAGSAPLKISYHTDNSVNNGGCYIDDITIYDLHNARYARHQCGDTSLYIFNNMRGEFLYSVIPEDTYGNLGNVSNLAAVYVDEYAVPYSIPNPFHSSCDIILDYPDSLAPSIEIFSLSGRKVKAFGAVQDTIIHWDGKDENGREVGSGLYYIFLKAGAFKKLGKIARQL